MSRSLSKSTYSVFYIRFLMFFHCMWPLPCQILFLLFLHWNLRESFFCRFTLHMACSLQIIFTVFTLHMVFTLQSPTFALLTLHVTCVTQNLDVSAFILHVAGTLQEPLSCCCFDTAVFPLHIAHTLGNLTFAVFTLNVANTLWYFVHATLKFHAPISLQKIY